MDYWMSREKLHKKIFIIVILPSMKIESNLSSLRQSDNSGKSLSSVNNSDSDMNLDEEIKKPSKITNQEMDRTRFIEMFNNWSKYTNPNYYKIRIGILIIVKNDFLNEGILRSSNCCSIGSKFVYLCSVAPYYASIQK